MIFHHEDISKERKPQTRVKTTANYARLSALSQRMGNVVQLDLTHGIRTFKKRVNTKKLYDAWYSRSYDSIMGVIPWENLHEDLQPAIDGFGRTLNSASKLSIAALPGQIDRHLRFDTSNPRIRSFLKSRSGELITRIQSDTREIVAHAVARSFDEALSPRTVAGLIKGSIGLYDQQETALRNYRIGLIKQNIHPDKIDSLCERYEDRLLTYRSRMIARTETRLATNHGQLAVWEQAADQDLIDRQTAEKVWVVDGDPCDICEPMDGVSVRLSDSWVLNTGDVVLVPTESHPHCFCGMELQIGE